MAKSTRSLLWAVAIVSICLAGVFAFRQQPDGWPWLLFAIPIWWPLWGVIVISGGPHSGPAAYELPLTFLLAVLMWWGIIEGGRRLWRRV